MPDIDSRLLDADCTEKIEENFNRTLALIDEGSGGGGADEFVVTFAYDFQESEWGITTAYADIYNAAANGAPIWMYTTDASNHEPPILVRMNVQEFSDPEEGTDYRASTHYIPVEYHNSSLQMDFFQFKFEASMYDGEAYVSSTVNKVEMVGASPE